MATFKFHEYYKYYFDLTCEMKVNILICMYTRKISLADNETCFLWGPGRVGRAPC